MQRLCFAIFAVLAGLVSVQASRQISFSPPTPAATSPPPPASPASPAPPSFFTPGLDFSIFIPGISSPPAFGTAQQNTLCSAITSSWALPSGRSSACTVGSVTSFNGTSVLVSGVAYFTWSTVPTINEIQVASDVRDGTIVALTATPSSVLGSAFAGAYANCACNGVNVVTKSSTAPFSYATTILGVPGPMQCDACLSYDTSNSNAAISQVGVDDGSVVGSNVGKFCSTPAVTNGVVGIPGSGSCRQYGVQFPESTTTATAYATAAGGSVTSITGGVCGGGVTTNCFTAGKGYTANPTVTVSAPTPTGVQVTFPWSGGGATPPITSDRLLATIVNPTNGPYASSTSYPIGTLGGGLCVDGGKGGSIATPPYNDHKCTGAITTIIDGRGITRNGYACTSADFNNGAGCASNRCITITNNAVVNVRFPGYTKGQTINTGFTYGVYCSAPPVITFDNSQSLQAATYAQFNAVISTSGATNGQVTSVTMVSPGSGYQSNPTLTIAPPQQSTASKLCGPNPITSLSSTIANPVSTSIAVGGTCSPLGRDTVNNVVCSVPAAPNGGVYSPLNAGTCNVVSSFIAQPSSTLTSTCGVLPQSFNVSATIPSPTPAPAPAPSSSSPTPAPAPSQSPSPPPAPSTPPTTKCKYEGTYYIESVSCPGKFIAYNNDPAKNACTNSTVMLRTASQSSGPRRYWKLSAEATEDVTPKSSSLIAAGREGKCDDDKLTNFAAAIGDPSPRLAGSAWKNKLIPVNAYKSCSVVYIQADTGNSNDGKNLKYGSCSSQTAFSWADSTAATTRWKLSKV